MRNIEENVIESNLLEFVVEKAEIVSYKQLPKAFLTILKTAGPYVASRLSASLLGIFNALVISRLDQYSVAAAPLITSIQFSIIGSARGFLLAVGIKTGMINEDSSIDDISGKKARKIGRLLFHGNIISIFLCLFSVTLFLISGKILNLFSIKSDITRKVEAYFLCYAIGVLPFLINVADQQFALGMKKSKITLISGFSYLLITAAFGYPLVFGVVGLPKLGIQGIGIGYTIAAWLNFIGLRIYFFYNKKFKKFKLFSLTFRDCKENFKDLIKYGIALGLQRLSEWGNIAVLVIIVGAFEKDFLIASQPSLQITIAVNTLLFALAQTSGILVSNLVGKAVSIYSEDKNKVEIVKSYLKNAKVIGDASIMTGVMLAIIPAIGLCVAPEFFTKLFAGIIHNNTVSRKIIQIAKPIFYMNAASVVGDCIRNVSAGALRGQKDMNFAPIISFITMSFFGLSSGYLLTKFLFKNNINPIFVTRLAGIVIAGIFILVRWFKKSSNLFDRIKNENYKNIIISDKNPLLFNKLINQREGEESVSEEDNLLSNRN